MDKFLNSNFRRVGQVLVFVACWITAMAWHLWRIATFRPAFENLSNRPSTIWSFAVAVAVALAGGLRWGLQNEQTYLTAALNLAINAVVYAAFTIRAGRSKTLFAALLGASAAVDLAAAAATLAGITSAPADYAARTVFLIAEIALINRVFNAFFSLPASIQAGTPGAPS